MARFSHLRTARLRLVPVTEVDADALAEAIGDFEIARWLTHVPYPYRRDDARAFQQASVGKEGRRWIILDAQGCAGGIGIDDELGYWLVRRAWGMGYATEAAHAALDAHFADEGAGEVASGYLEGNARSARVLAKLGFAPAGEAEVRPRSLDREVRLVRMRLGRDDWAAARLRLARI